MQWLDVGSQFPDQELNPSPSNESTKSYPLDLQGAPEDFLKWGGVPAQSFHPECSWHKMWGYLKTQSSWQWPVEWKEPHLDEKPGALGLSPSLVAKSPCDPGLVIFRV